MTRDDFELLVAGVGAIGSRLARRTDVTTRLTCLDAERVAPENVGVAAFDGDDLGAAKAAVVAARHRARGGVARPLTGDLRYLVRPGLVRALAGACLCLDNPRAIRDAAEALWIDAREIPIVMLTCGGAAGGWQARVFVPGGPCPVCLFGEAERRAARAAEGVSCADTTAPRAAADAAEAAAGAGIEILEHWRAGDRSLVNCRVQCDPGGEPFIVRMPAEASRGCSAGHARSVDDIDVEALGGSVEAVTVADLAERALARCGADAEILLGRRAVPTAGLYCPACPGFAAALPRLLPAAIAAARLCDCDIAPRPLGLRTSVGARELLDPALAPLALRAWGAAPGDELLAEGSRGRVRLAADFDWRELDGE